MAQKKNARYKEITANSRNSCVAICFRLAFLGFSAFIERPRLRQRVPAVYFVLTNRCVCIQLSFRYGNHGIRRPLRPRLIPADGSSRFTILQRVNQGESIFLIIWLASNAATVALGRAISGFAIAVLILARRSFPIDKLDQLPGILAEIDLQLSFLIHHELSGWIQKT
jgi:hypothetical protein